MHELSVCQALLSQVSNIAAEHGARQVTRIRLQIGPLAGVEPALLQQAFSIARCGGCAAQAELDIESMPIAIRCRDCATEAQAQPSRLCCPACGSIRTILLSGDEMLLRQVELETPSSPRARPH